MRSIWARRRTVRLAVMAASLALLAAACTGAGDPAEPSGSDGDGVLGGIEGVELVPGILLISNGTDRVTIGDATVRFPGPVTDAAWSPDGSRIAYVDGDGNIATARPDGSDVLVLTATDRSVVRSRPSWSRQWLLYAEKKADGTSALRSVPTNGCPIGRGPVTGEDWWMDTGDGTSYIDLAPSASTARRPMRIAFQHDEPSGPEIWVNDSNQRVPRTYKLVDGSEPALSLDGQKLAYVGRDGDIYVSTLPMSTAPGTRVSAGAQHATRLVWSPDGQHIAYSTDDSVQQVSASGEASAPTALAPTKGVPSYLPGSDNFLFPVTAADPTALSIAASQARWAGVGFFAPGQGYEGALSATIALAQQPPAVGAPFGPTLLIGESNQLDPRIVAELRRVFGAVDTDAEEWARPTVSVAEGVSAAIDAELRAIGYLVSREPLQEAYSNDLCASNDGRALFEQRLVVVNRNDSAAVGLGRSFAINGPVLKLDGELTEEQRAWLRHSSGVVESVYVIGSVPEEVQQQIADLLAGPLGFTTTHNPVAPSLS